MAKKQTVSKGEARARISAALGNKFSRVTMPFRDVEVKSSGPDLARVNIKVPSHSKELRAILGPHFRSTDKFEVRAISHSGWFEIRARNLDVIVKAVEKALPSKKGKK
ncbi:hypothetical protein KKI23_01815 [Patescibacteria group bacterium]|nr:hypothetical protein [Patescibacteria group bacterium]